MSASENAYYAANTSFQTENTNVASTFVRHAERTEIDVICSR